jgi:chloramphenicol O-acetyltransferase
MKLTDTIDSQESEATTYHEPRISFTFTAHEETSETLTETTVTFSYFKEAHEWSLHEYKEKECDASKRPGERDWKLIHDIHWHEFNKINESIDIPPAIMDEFNDMLDLDVIKLDM